MSLYNNAPWTGIFNPEGGIIGQQSQQPVLRPQAQTTWLPPNVFGTPPYDATPKLPGAPGVPPLTGSAPVAPIPAKQTSPAGMIPGAPGTVPPAPPTPQAPAPPTSAGQSPVSNTTQGLSDLSKVLGSFSSGEKADRALQGQFTQNYDQLMLQAAENRRADEADAMKKLAIAGYIGQGGSHFNPGSVQLNGQDRQLSSYGMAPPAISAAQQQGASTLQDQMLQRLQPGGSYTPQPLNSYAKPGTAEKIGSYGGAIAGGAGALDSIFSGGNQPSATGNTLNAAGQVANTASTLSKIPGLGSLGATGSIGSKVIPGVGAAYGVYDMIHNDHGVLGNIGSGAATGASIGSIVPGLGTGIGAGVGALVGGLKSLFHHKPKAPTAPAQVPTQTGIPGFKLPGSDI